MGTLYIVATPIGNLEDITYRAVKILPAVDLILCEDTRHTGLLLQHLHISTPLQAYYDEIEDKKIPEVIQLLKTKSIALVSDAGTPLISDPGFRLVRECIKRNIRVVSVPGSSAILAALTISGLPPDKFMFLGFFDKKNLSYIQKNITTIFYCSPHKVARNLEELKEKFGDIDIVLARELTKIHEETWRGKISEALDYFNNPQGEFVLLFRCA